MKTEKSLQRALDEALRLAPFGLSKKEVDRIRAMAEEDWEPPKDSEARKVLEARRG